MGVRCCLELTMTCKLDVRQSLNTEEVFCVLLLCIVAHSYSLTERDSIPSSDEQLICLLQTMCALSLRGKGCGMHLVGGLGEMRTINHLIGLQHT